MHRIVSATVHPAMRLILLALALCLSATASAEEPDVRTTWRLLDYIAVDYASAVSDGRVADEFEYREMVEFSDVVARQVAAFPDTKDNQALIRRSDQLRALIANKEPAERVGRFARALAASLLTAYPVPLAPSQAPDLVRARTLFAQNCASCHGAAGSAPPAAMQALDPPPIDFTDIDRARQRSAFGLYQVITQGLEGTSMASFASLSDEDRWALAFYAGSIAFEDVAKGERIWREDDGIRQLVPDLQTLAALTPESLAEQIGEDRALAVMAYLRANPDAVGQANDAGSLAFVRDMLDRSLSAYQAGDREEARELALSAYLDGFEPLEALLATRDGGLMREVEQALGQFRAGIESGADPSELQQLRARIDSLLASAEGALAPEAASEISTFLGAFTILLREGIEALLVVIAMIAFVKKSQRSEVLPYVHGGWIAALLAGVATWVVATYFVSISGASREMTEGIGALLAAVILVSVGIWMHGKSQAEEWRRYIQEKMGKALSRGSAWFLFGLAFVVVYREAFETILFYAALWNPQSSGIILAGALSAVALLALIAWAMLRYSRKLPITQFFRYSAILIAILAVILAGKGVGAFQEAGVLTATFIAGLPRLAELGFFPTVETIVAQLLTLLALIVGFRVNRAFSNPPPANVTG
ncbi:MULTISPECIES: cytochrome c/FTR1 family iron permease [Erythrobacteraceae]|jgi:high-affinity iron transporter|uniref:Cytochrome c/FTR1 family iron permease n=1 Tax=Erythrobacter westpacificensis TaxID=1055231 RepID=A0ABP9KSM5_9SPHN|nr:MULTISPECIES: cytochrome c/FTR1 family iron permease [Erythrobacteraceae]MBW3168002.1 cytochrome c/FTR1 family iron permease [Qipengyuania flava]MBY5965240.1 cytochrome c/FTR1 family iron permease [Qipengyuania flava]MBY6011564.1 cytochrome c/FTR1 family iron permease [Qipengyuania flava]MBY6026006.1 cytochrome c/FTR1 family iron permease [Qipengyuania flava]